MKKLTVFCLGALAAGCTFLLGPDVIWPNESLWVPVCVDSVRSPPSGASCATPPTTLTITFRLDSVTAPDTTGAPSQ